MIARPLAPIFPPSAAMMSLLLLSLAGSANAATAAWEEENTRQQAQATKLSDVGDFSGAANVVGSFVDRWRPALTRGDDGCANSSCRQRLATAVKSAEQRQASLLRLARAEEAVVADARNACRDYLELLARSGQSGGRMHYSYEHRTHALKVLIEHHPDVQAFFASHFPARIVIEEAGGLKEADRLYLVRALEQAGDAAGIPLSPRGAGELRLRVDVEENDTRDNFIFRGTSMHSYTIRLVMELVGPNGTSLAVLPETRSVLGINVAHAARSDFNRYSERAIAALVDEVLYRTQRGDL